MIVRHIVNIPQLSANDASALVTGWHKKTGEFIKKGEYIASIETSKAVFDVEVSEEGYLMPLAKAGEEVPVGSPLAVLSTNPSDSFEQIMLWLGQKQKIPYKLNEEKKKYTKKALILAKQLCLDIDEIPVNSEKLTEQDVRDYYTKIKNPQESAKKYQGNDLVDDLYPYNKMQRLLIIGGGMGSVQIVDALNSNKKQRVVAILDDNPELNGKTVMGIPIVGKTNVEYGLELYNSKRFDAAIISISTNIEIREKFYSEWRQAGIPFTNIFHPTAFIGSNVAIGTGNVILAFCHIGACTKIGDNNFLSSFANIEHHNILGNNCSFGPGVCFSACIKVGSNVRFGTGIYVEPYLSIGSNSIIASGSVIIKNVPSDSIVKTHVNISVRQKENDKD